MVSVEGKVPVKTISKTFAASGKTEKLVYQTLSDLGFQKGKVRNPYGASSAHHCIALCIECAQNDDLPDFIERSKSGHA